MSKSRTNTPSKQAEDLLGRLNICKVPVPLTRIARAEGATIRCVPLDEELSGMIYIKQGIPIIGVNALHHPHRQRFTIAHEIGHLILHRSYITDQIHVDKEFSVDLGLHRDTQSTLGTAWIEVEANQFAASLLMPSFFIEPIMSEMKFDIDNERPMENLARKLHVSKQALQFRILNLR